MVYRRAPTVYPPNNPLRGLPARSFAANNLNMTFNLRFAAAKLPGYPPQADSL
jgi:hypothetical protein